MDDPFGIFTGCESSTPVENSPKRTNPTIDYTAKASKGAPLTTVTLPDGTLAPVNVANVIGNETLSEVLSMAVTKPYEGKDPKHIGKTKLQAGMDSLVDRFATGDKEAAVIVMDRLGGKPAQVTKNLNVTTDLQGFLENLR